MNEIDVATLRSSLLSGKSATGLDGCRCPCGMPIAGNNLYERILSTSSGVWFRLEKACVRCGKRLGFCKLLGENG